jgi:hypothetical protein
MADDLDYAEADKANIELLQWAAKAAGFVNYTCCIGYGLFIETGASRGDSGYYWNPIQNSGDAFRLMVHLNLHVGHQYINPIRVYLPQLGVKIYQAYGDNREQAVRLAITLAAAQIGKGMP